MQTNGQDLWIIIRNFYELNKLSGLCLIRDLVIFVINEQFELETVTSIDDTISKFICTGLKIDKSINLTLKQRYKSIYKTILSSMYNIQKYGTY